MEKIKKRYVNVKSLSQYTSLSARTLYEWTTSGRIPSINVGRRVLFDLEDIDMFLAGLKRDTGKVDRVIKEAVETLNGNGYNASSKSHSDTFCLGKEEGHV
mgnify:CR=1 FL=1